MISCMVKFRSLAIMEIMEVHLGGNISWRAAPLDIHDKFKMML